jgi:hypothetical protein
LRPSSRIASLASAPLLLAALLGASASSADAAPSVAPTPTPTPSVASIPAAVQPLVAKIAAQQVNSERYSVTTHASGAETIKLRGDKRRKVRLSKTVSATGEASLKPLVAKLYRHGDSGQLSSIAIGSKVYVYAPSPKHKRRPWLALGLSGLSAASLFPYHGLDDPAIEVDAGGTGTYAELIDLLATANGAVTVAGTAIVDGQQTTELKATVRPLALIQGSKTETGELTEQLEAFVTEAGLPVRVAKSERFNSLSVTETTEILAVNVPVTAKAPPKSKTISARKALKGMTGDEHEGGTGLKI